MIKKQCVFSALFLSIILLGAGCTQQTQSQPAPESAVNSSELIESNDAVKVAEPIEEDDPTTTSSGVTNLYRGYFFDVEYPENFTASPDGPKNEYNGQEIVQTDAATVESPDGGVVFYVYSPLWGGEPDYLKTASNELLVDENMTVEDGDFGQTITRWVTVKADDGSYYRSFVSIREQVGTGSEVHHVFGIKYENQASYDQYRDEYLQFKSSLRQYAD